MGESWPTGDGFISAGEVRLRLTALHEEIADLRTKLKQITKAVDRHMQTDSDMAIAIQTVRELVKNG